LLLFQEQQALNYELNQTIDLQRRVSLRQAELLDDQKAKVAALEKKLEESQGCFRQPASLFKLPTCSTYMTYLIFWTGADLKSSLASTSSELENLCSTHKDLESKLKDAEEKQKLVDDQLTQKSSEFGRTKVDLQDKREKDAKISKKLQSEVKTLRTYMRRAEAGWDMLNSEIFSNYPDLKPYQLHSFSCIF
jgi:DNA repair exonuclease SbcCD ATPase subunit